MREPNHVQGQLLEQVAYELHIKIEQVVHNLSLVQISYKSIVEFEQIPFELLYLEISLNPSHFSNHASGPRPSNSNTSFLSQTVQTNMGVIRNILLDKI